MSDVDLPMSLGFLRGRSSNAALARERGLGPWDIESALENYHAQWIRARTPAPNEDLDTVTVRVLATDRKTGAPVELGTTRAVLRF